MNLQINGGPRTEMSRRILRPQRPFNPPIHSRADSRSLASSLRLFRSFACILFLLFLTMTCASTARAQGALTNGWTHSGTISSVGDSDSWTFSANAGDSIVLRVGKITQSGSFNPRIRLLNPNAVQQASASSSVAAEIAVVATNTGTFTVIVDDLNSAATATYRLTLAKSPGSVFVAPGDEGGPMTNDVMHTGTIDVGDLDVWNFTANAGETVLVRMGEAVSGSGLTPWFRLYGPDGALLGSSFNSAQAVEVGVQATNSGVFTVVAGDGSSFLTGSGDYRLTLAKTGDAIVVSSGDEGGLLNGSATYSGNLDEGDLDEYAFAACAGEAITLQMTEVTSGSSLSPWIRLYDRSGNLLNSVAGAATALISRAAPVSGNYTVVLSDGSSFLSGSGAYTFAVNGLSSSMKLCVPAIAGTNAAISGVGGVTNAPFVLFTTTNARTLTALWTPIRTNQFNGFGVFVYTNLYNSNEFQRYFRLRTP